MRDARNVLFRYLDLRQHLWNVYFIDLVTDISECEPLDTYEAIATMLFRVLVADPLKIQLPPAFQLGMPLDAIVVKPKPGDRIELMVGRSKPPSTYWDRATSQTSGLVLSFVDFFQWDNYGFQSASAVRCEIKAYPNHPEYIGREAIVESLNVDFLVAEAAD